VIAAGPGRPRVYLLSDAEDLSTACLVRLLRQSLNRHVPLLAVPVSFLELAAKLVGGQEAVQRLCGSLQVDSSAFQDAFQWNPPFSPTQGIAATVAAHRVSN
jgi:nucleoside-diphosphate-sugar epimerase